MDMVMKKVFSIRFSVLLTLLCSITISCSDDFLDVAVQGGVDTSSDPELAQKLVTGVYSSLMQGDSWGNGDVHGFAFISASSIMSDDADKGSTPTDQAVPVGAMDDFTVTPTNKFCETLWSGHYNTIGAANQALRALEDPSIEEGLRNQLIGEVRFLRAYMYFNLVRIFGGVPLVLRVPIDANDANNDPVFQTRATVAEVYASIIADLTFAAANLPLKGVLAPGHA